MVAVDIYVAAVRPKQGAFAQQDFRQKFYEILISTKPSGDKHTWSLPKFSISQNDDPKEATLVKLYLFTGGDHGGVRGERAVIVYKTGGDNSPSSPSQNNIILLCVPVNPRDKPYRTSESLGFYSMESVVENVNTGKWFVSPGTKTCVKKLENWLSEFHNRPKAIECLFRSRAEYRVCLCVNNPAFIPNSKLDLDEGNTSKTQDIRLTANEALAKMLSIEKCDKVVMNPLFGSGLPYKTKVDNVVDNIHWGRGLPKYEEIQSPKENRQPPSEEQWEKDFPLHKCAYDNDITVMKELLADGYSHSKLDTGSKWAPIHYAAWRGNVEAVGVLLDAGCDPNIKNKKSSTPLHFAALCGHPYVVMKLLDHSDTDYEPLDSEGKIPLNCCEHVPKTDWQQCAFLLKYSKIQVSLMNEKTINLNLASGESTTVLQLNQQLMKVLNLPYTCSHLFTIWICSPSLELQLKLDHKPRQHLQDWKRICVKLTDGNSHGEEPVLVWRRDALLTPKEENNISHPAAIQLLFYEAYHNYIKALYPCSDNDVLMFAAILTYMSQGEYDQAKAKAFFSNVLNLQSLIPASKLKNRNNNYHRSIQQRYKSFCSEIADKDKSMQALQMKFLKWCRNLTVYGSAFFHGAIEHHGNKQQKALKVLIGVNDVGLHLINADTRDMHHCFKYSEIDWQQVPERPILEVVSKVPPRTTTSVRTKQAGLITHLMMKMASL